jgi:mono/diheme cytochrome c family protein
MHDHYRYSALLLALSISQSWAAGDDLTKKTAGMDPAVRDAGLSYTVQCEPEAKAAEACSVDKDTYNGWRAFSAHCLQCHGGSAMGSTFAPNLMERFNDHVDHERFEYVLHNGFTGNMGAMPSFATNPAVLKAQDQLYRYLRSRADGVLPAGRPKRLK